MHRNSGRGLVPPGVLPIGHHVGRLRRRHHLERRKHQIEAQIASINARDQASRRKRETRANIIIGAVVRRHAALHSAFATALGEILDVAVRRRADRELLASILGFPALAGGADAVAPAQTESGATHSNVARPAAPPRSGFARHATEITATR
jgi:hypothetical protein